MKYKNKRKNKRKLNLFRVVNAILFIWFIISIILIVFLSNKSYSYKENLMKEIIVSKGETLWDIAEREKYNNEYYENYDIRDIIKEIKLLNNLQDSNIYDNEILKVVEI